MVLTIFEVQVTIHEGHLDTSSLPFSQIFQNRVQIHESRSDTGSLGGSHNLSGPVYDLREL